MKKISLLFLCALMLISCTTESESEVSSNGDALLTIKVDDNLIPQSKRVFYIVKGEGGEDLVSGELFNADEIELRESTYNEATIAISIFEYQTEFERGEISSYLNVPVGKSMHLNTSSSPFPDAQAKVAFNNLDTTTEEIRLSTSGWFVVTNANIIGNDQQFSFAFNPDAPFTIASFLPVNGIPKYQNLTLDTSIDNIINSVDNVDMENQHTINAPISSLGSFNYSTRLSGLLTPDPSASGGYSLYEDRSPDIAADEITLYSPAIFENFTLTLTAESNSLRYRQSTVGTMPTTFNYIDPEITVANASLASVDITATGDDASIINTYWRMENSNQISWNVFLSASNSMNYNIQEIPTSILDELNIQNQFTVSLQSASALSIDALGFSDAINLLFTNTNFNTKNINAKVKLSKTLSF